MYCASPFLLLLVGPLLTPGPVDRACVELEEGHFQLASPIGLVLDDTMPARILSEAVAMWEICRDLGVQLPELRVGATGTVSYRVRRQGVGHSARCGSLQGLEIVVYTSTRYQSGLRRCGPPQLILAHEIGHLLGLRDADGDLRCQGSIMSRIHANNRERRQVTLAECLELARRWGRRALEVHWARGRDPID